MSIFFEYNEKVYPDLIRQGNHTQYITPFAQKVCVGDGVDVGCAKENWTLPGVTHKCDLTMSPPWNDAYTLPLDDAKLDYVFSSHCLEHLDDYYAGLQEWARVIKSGGILFLYLPSIECEYWRPANDRKHKNILYPADMEYDLKTLGFKNILVSGVDLAYSYSVVGQKI